MKKFKGTLANEDLRKYGTGIPNQEVRKLMEEEVNSGNYKYLVYLYIGTPGVVESENRTSGSDDILKGIHTFNYDVNKRPEAFSDLTNQALVVKYMLNRYSLENIMYTTAIKERIRWLSMRIMMNESSTSRIVHEFERAKLPMGNLTDFALANAQYMAGTFDSDYDELTDAAIKRLEWLDSLDDKSVFNVPVVNGLMEFDA